jgi:hypothetical protein
MKLADAFKQACEERKELHLHIRPPNEDCVYRVEVRPLTYSHETGQVTGLKSNGQRFEMYDRFVPNAEVADTGF